MRAFGQSVIRNLAVWVVLGTVAAPLTATADTVMITGANSGIGLEFARQYAALGWTVIATTGVPSHPNR
jgi:hypothetical protein